MAQNCLELFTSSIPKQIQDGASWTKTLPSTVVFDITGNQGGVWSLVQGAAGLSVKPEKVTPHACVIQCSEPVLQALLERKLNMRQAFDSGQMKIQGSFDLAMKMGIVFHG